MLARRDEDRHQIGKLKVFQEFKDDLTSQQANIGESIEILDHWFESRSPPHPVEGPNDYARALNLLPGLLLLRPEFKNDGLNPPKFQNDPNLQDWQGKFEQLTAMVKTFRTDTFEKSKKHAEDALKAAREANIDRFKTTFRTLMFWEYRIPHAAFVVVMVYALLKLLKWSISI